MVPSLLYQVMWWLLAGLAVIGALMVVTRRNPVHSAMFLVLTLFASSGLYLLLYAHFIAVIQILVYAGAIMVFFIFTIMLLNLHEHELRIPRITPAKVLALVLTLLLAAKVVFMIRQMPGRGGEIAYRLGAWYPEKAPPIPPESYGTAHSIGAVLFSRFLLPFEVASVLLLAVTIGAVMVMRRHEPGEARLKADSGVGLSPPPQIVIEEEMASASKKVEAA